VDASKTISLGLAVKYEIVGLVGVEGVVGVVGEDALPHDNKTRKLNNKTNNMTPRFSDFI
jgi:hypothetical protein